MITFNSKLKHEINMDFLSTYPWLSVLSKEFIYIGLKDDLILINLGNNKPILEFFDDQFIKSKYLEFNGKYISIEVFSLIKIRSFNLSYIYPKNLQNKLDELRRVGFLDFHTKVEEVSIFNFSLKKEELIIDYENYDGTDQSIPVFFDLDIDSQICFTFTNKTSLLFLYDPERNNYLIYFGSKQSFSDNYLLQDNWFENNSKINFTENTCYKNTI